MTDRVQTMMPVVIDQHSLSDIEKMATYVAKSGLFGVKTPEQAVSLMMLAQAEGMHPMIAARDYDIIQGRPSKKAEAMLRDFQRAGGSVQWHALSDTDAKATFSHPQGGSVTIDWDLKRANAAGLGAKDMWKKFPRQMLRSRVVSEGCKTIWPSATSGMYTPEEVNDFRPADNVVPMRDVTPSAAPLTEVQYDANSRLQALQGAADVSAPETTKKPRQKPAKEAHQAETSTSASVHDSDAMTASQPPLTWIWIAPDGRFRSYDTAAQWLEALRAGLPAKSADDCEKLMSRMNDTFNELRAIDPESVAEASRMINERFIDAHNV